MYQEGIFLLILLGLLVRTISRCELTANERRLDEGGGGGEEEVVRA